MIVFLRSQRAYLLSHPAAQPSASDIVLPCKQSNVFLSPFEKGRLSRAATYLGRAVLMKDAGVVCRLGGICNDCCAANYKDHIITGRKVREDGLQKRR
jgi:hypothetical protein